MKQTISVMKSACTLKQWQVKAGDRVQKGDLLCRVLVGPMQITREVASPFSGQVLEIFMQNGETVPGGAPVCALETVAEGNAPPPEQGPLIPAGEVVPVKLPKTGGPASVKMWHKAEGDLVKQGEPLVSVAAGKMNTDVASPVSGTLIQIAAQAGASVKKDDLLACVESDGTSHAPAVPKATRVVVVGGGPGGYVAAIRAAQLGASVLLIEMKTLGGTCLNVGCIPTKALLHSAEVYTAAKHGETVGIRARDLSIDWAAVQAHRAAVSARLISGVEGLLAAHGVEVLEGRASFRDAHTLSVVKAGGETLEVQADRFILASGSIPVMPPIPGLAETPNCVDSTGALTLDALPKSMVIIGGGVIGIELACTYAAFGTQVTIVEMMPRILPMMDDELTRAAQGMMEKQGIRFSLETQVTGLEACETGARVRTRLKTGKETAFEAEKVLVAVGRRSNIASLHLEAAGVETERGHIVTNSRLETNIPGIYAIGDCTGKTMLAHTASAMGEIAAENALGEEAKYDERVCPSCVYMTPEFACVGLNEEEANAQKLDYKVGKFPLEANGKSVIMGQTGGWVKILADARTSQILGVHILGARATDLIAEGAMAMKMKAGVEDIIQTIHAHPTVAEAMKEAALAVEGRAIHYK